MNTFDSDGGGVAAPGNATAATALAAGNGTHLADTLIVNGSLCVVTITHASVGNSPVCTLVSGDNASGVIQTSNVDASCDASCDAAAPAPEAPADDNADAPPAPPAPVTQPTSEEHVHMNESHETDDSQHEWVNETHVDESEHTWVNESHESDARGDTCAENGETVCDQDEESTTQECAQESQGALVNVQVCNVHVEPVDDVTVNDVVDVVRGDVDVDVEDNDVTVTAPVDADATLP